MTSCRSWSKKNSPATMQTRIATTDRRMRPRSSRKWSARAMRPSAPTGCWGFVRNIRTMPVATLTDRRRDGCAAQRRAGGSALVPRAVVVGEVGAHRVGAHGADGAPWPLDLTRLLDLAGGLGVLVAL